MDELEELRRKKMMEIVRKKSLDHPIELSDATFQPEVGKHPLLVVDCWAPWCGPCRMIAPIIEELAKEYAGKIVFGKLNVDENKQTAAQYRILSIPSLLVFKSGKLVDTLVGAMPRKALEPKITKYLS